MIEAGTRRGLLDAVGADRLLRPREAPAAAAVAATPRAVDPDDLFNRDRRWRRRGPAR